MSEPRPYRLDNPEELERFFREMKGYLRVSKFLETGPDYTGRLYAFHAFYRLEKKIKEWKMMAQPSDPK